MGGGGTVKVRLYTEARLLAGNCNYHDIWTLYIKRNEGCSSCPKLQYCILMHEGIVRSRVHIKLYVTSLYEMTVIESWAAI